MGLGGYLPSEVSQRNSVILCELLKDLAADDTLDSLFKNINTATPISPGQSWAVSNFQKEIGILPVTFIAMVWRWIFQFYLTRRLFHEFVCKPLTEVLIMVEGGPDSQRQKKDGRYESRWMWRCDDVRMSA